MGRRLLALGGILVGLAVCLSRTPDRPARAADADDELTPPAKLRPLYISAESCGQTCHALAQPRKNDKYPPMCRCTEYRIWKGEGNEPGDKHSDASLLLKSPRAAEMARLLQWDAKPEDDPRCLNCHGLPSRDRNLLDRPDDIVKEGVTCVICHGATSNWVAAHHGNYIEKDLTSWRRLKRSDKDAKWGMRDLWDPGKRTRLCASCHVGSVEEGRILTHEMYAAGHPPLPGFEPAAFSESMRHWRYRVEKPDAVQKMLGYEKGQMERAQLVAVGAAVVYESSMRLLAGQARECAQKSRTLDVANFDCAACHHELRSPSWRQERGHAGSRPGRPPAPAWPAALLRAAVACSEEFDPKRTEASLRKYDHLAAGLRSALATQPFGKPAEVADAASNLADWAAELAKKVGKTMKDDEARRFLRALCDLPPGEVLDYDSARQIAWAVKMVAADLEQRSSEVEQGLTALDSDLRLTLPQGRRPTIVDQLEDALKVRSRYDPRTFREQITRLRDSLK